MMKVQTLHFLHKWLGLGLGLWLVLVTLTGTIWTVWDAVEATGASPVPSTPCVELSRDAHWRAALQAEGEQIVRLDALDEAFRQLRVIVMDRDGARHVRHVDQCSGAMTSSPDAWETFFATVTWLHGTLLPGAIGKLSIGLLGILTFLSIAIGVWLWWVRNGRSLRKALTISSSRQGLVRLRSWHYVAGALATLPLALLVASGTLLAYAPWLTESPAISSHCVDGARIRGLGPYLDSVQRLVATQVPDGAIRSIRLDARHCVARIYAQSRSVIPTALNDRLWIDLAGERVIAHVRGADTGVGYRGSAWASVIHSGELFGRSGWLLTLAGGLLLLGLTVTGAWIYFWARKLQARVRAGARNRETVRA